jgi:hypothetical protein
MALPGLGTEARSGGRIVGLVPGAGRGSSGQQADYLGRLPCITVKLRRQGPTGCDGERGFRFRQVRVKPPGTPAVPWLVRGAACDFQAFTSTTEGTLT